MVQIELIDKDNHKITFHATDGDVVKITNGKDSFEPSFSRAEVLSEKWEPKSINPCFSDYFIITDKNIIEKGFFTFAMLDGIRNYFNTKGYSIYHLMQKNSLRLAIDNLFSFSPTRELAEEIVSIREGNWLPKKGDRIFSLYRNSFGIVCNGRYDDLPRESDATLNSIADYVYFPTPEQRNRFVAEHPKRKEEIKVCPECHKDYHCSWSSCPDCHAKLKQNQEEWGSLIKVLEDTAKKLREHPLSKNINVNIEFKPMYNQQYKY